MSSVTKDYFYAENYFDYAVQLHSFGNHTAGSATQVHWNSLNRVILVILSRVGFILVQIGSVPINSVNLILLQNVIDFSCVTVMYFLTGYLVAYNGDLTGLTGKGRWIGDPEIDRNEAITGWQAVAIASAISTTAVVGRMHTVGYLLVGLLLAGLIQPLLIHWAWTAEGWMATGTLNDRKVVFKDYAGSAVVHVVGGLSGLVGCVTLGRRMLRLRDLDDASITSSSASTVSAGLLFVLVGLQGLCASAYDRDKLRASERDTTQAYVNNLLAASSCSLLVVALHFALSREAFNHWTVIRCIQSTIAGVITVSAAANEYSPQAAIGLGCLGGVVFYVISRLIFHSALEDYCNVVAAHLGCAAFGSVLAPICAWQAGEDVTKILLNFSWQLICLVALSALVGTVMLLLFGLLERCGILRNRSEYLNHTRANAAVDRGPPRSFLQRLFFPDRNSLYLQPGLTANTGNHPVGSRFRKYQSEIDSLEEGRPVVSKSEAKGEIENNAVREQPSGARVKKMRQVHTISRSAPALTRDRGGTGESINGDPPSIGRRSFLGKEMRYTLDPIAEIDDEDNWKELEVEERNGRCDVVDKSLLLKEIVDTPVKCKEDTSEWNYRLRRTVKLLNLHHEFVREDLKVVLAPKRWTPDSSSSDSCDEDRAFARTTNSNELAKDIAPSDDSLIQRFN